MSSYPDTDHDEMIQLSNNLSTNNYPQTIISTPIKKRRDDPGHMVQWLRVQDIYLDILSLSPDCDMNR